MKKEVESKNQRYPDNYSLKWVMETFGHRDPHVDLRSLEAYSQPGVEDHFIFGGYGQGSGCPYADVRVLVRSDTSLADARRLLWGIIQGLDEVLGAIQEGGHGE